MVASQWVPASFSLLAVLFWGTSDFVGGYAVRRAPVFIFTTIAHASAAALMVSLALFHHANLPSRNALQWSLAAGVFAGLALALFYRALAAGKMGLTTPVTAVLSAGIPAVVVMSRQGVPGLIPLTGFALAGIGIWLISRPENDSRPEGLWLAVLSGIGFAGYFLCIKQAGPGSVLWIAGSSRVCSLAVTGLIVAFGGKLPVIARSSVAWATFAGFIDVSGSAFFVRAAQTGRLDSVVVISSLYPAITVLLARILLKEHLSRWKAAGMLASLAAVPMIALQ
jgi:drug/metabolite transporter (DMT)-like permease